MTTQTLWTAAKHMFQRMCDKIGDAAAIAARDWLSKEEQRDIRAWLAPLIAMVRNIVLIEAAALARLPQPQLPPLPLVPWIKRALGPKPAPRAHGNTISLRLWPKPDRSGPRARQLGPPVLVRDIWRDRQREAAARQLQKVRFMRPPPQLQLSRRIEALERLMARPLAAARRLARKLRLAPKLARKLGAKLLPRTKLYTCPEYGQSESGAFAVAMSFDTS